MALPPASRRRPASPVAPAAECPRILTPPCAEWLGATGLAPRVNTSAVRRSSQLLEAPRIAGPPAIRPECSGCRPAPESPCRERESTVSPIPLGSIQNAAQAKAGPRPQACGSAVHRSRLGPNVLRALHVAFSRSSSLLYIEKEGRGVNAAPARPVSGKGHRSPPSRPTVPSPGQGRGAAARREAGVRSGEELPFLLGSLSNRLA